MLISSLVFLLQGLFLYSRGLLERLDEQIGMTNIYISQQSSFTFWNYNIRDFQTLVTAPYNIVVVVVVAAASFSSIFYIYFPHFYFVILYKGVFVATWSGLIPFVIFQSLLSSRDDGHARTISVSAATSPLLLLFMSLTLALMYFSFNYKTPYEVKWLFTFPHNHVSSPQCSISRLVVSNKGWKKSDWVYYLKYSSTNAQNEIFDISWNVIWMNCYICCVQICKLSK